MVNVLALMVVVAALFVAFGLVGRGQACGGRCSECGDTNCVGHPRFGEHHKEARRGHR